MFNEDCLMYPARFLLSNQRLVHIKNIINITCAIYSLIYLFI